MSRKLINKALEQSVKYINPEISKSIITDDALRESESRYRRLFETTQDGILILDAGTGQIQDVNPFLLKMLGYSHNEFLDKKLWERLCPKAILCGNAVKKNTGGNGRAISAKGEPIIINPQQELRHERAN